MNDKSGMRFINNAGFCVAGVVSTVLGKLNKEGEGGVAGEGVVEKPRKKASCELDSTRDVASFVELCAPAVPPLPPPEEKLSRKSKLPRLKVVVGVIVVELAGAACASIVGVGSAAPMSPQETDGAIVLGCDVVVLDVGVRIAGGCLPGARIS